jgi:hypothetical protein
MSEGGACHPGRTGFPKAWIIIFGQHCGAFFHVWRHPHNHNLEFVLIDLSEKALANVWTNTLITLKFAEE